MSGANERLVAAREQARMSPEDVAAAAGISTACYYDLESAEGDIFSAVSFGKLGAIARVLGVQLAYILAGCRPDGSGKRMTMNGLADALSNHLRGHHQSVEAFESAVGWEVAQFLRRPSTASGWTIDYLREVSDAIGVDWVDVVRGTDAAAAPDEENADDEGEAMQGDGTGLFR